MSSARIPLRRSTRRPSFSVLPPTSPHSNSTSGNSPLNLPSAFISETITEQVDLERGLDTHPDQDTTSIHEVKPGSVPSLTLNDHGSNAHSYTPSESSQDDTNNLDHNEDFWNAYNLEAEREDNGIIYSYGADFDTLLIFAGLFSATTTAFIVESYKTLKPEPSEITNDLLRSLIRTIHQSSLDESALLLEPVKSTSRAIRVNTFFFVSLSCSLFSAFGAVVGKQWLNDYEREGQLSSASARGVERQRKFMGLAKWKFTVVVEMIRTILQLSLLFFFIGLIDFIWPLNIFVASTVMAISITVIAFWVFTIFIGIYVPDSPYQSAPTSFFRKFLGWGSSGTGKTRRKESFVKAHCVDWLKKRTAFPSAARVVVRAALQLTADAKRAINLDHWGVMLAYLLRPSMYKHQIYLGISPEDLQSSLMLLHDLVSSWDKYADIVHPEDLQNIQFLCTLRREVWNILTKPGTEALDVTSTNFALDILGELGAPEQGEAGHVEYLINSLDSKVLKRSEQLLRLNVLHHALHSQGHLNVKSYVKTASNVAEILALTMWGPEEEPDLDPRRVALRLSWFVNDDNIDHNDYDRRTMYQHIRDQNFSQYLTHWRSSDQQTDSLTSLGPAVLTKLYLQSIIRLLKYNPVWARELDRDGHLNHLQTASRDMLAPDIQLLCWISFLLLAGVGRWNEETEAPSSAYFSEEWVALVLRILNTDGLPWATEPTVAFSGFPKALYWYLRTARRYEKISAVNAREAFKAFRDLRTRMELGEWKDDRLWVSDVEPLIDELEREEMEREASQSIVKRSVNVEKEMALELDYLVDGLTGIKNGETQPALSDADKIIALLQNGPIDKSLQLIGLDFLSYVLLGLPKSDVHQIVTNNSSSAHIAHMLLSTMWQTDPAKLSLHTLDSDARQRIVDYSEPRLELRRMWLGQSPRKVHAEFREASFDKYLISRHLVYPTHASPYLHTVIVLFDTFPDIWHSSLEEDGHVKRIATLAGTSPTPGPDASKTRTAQWIALRLFLAMWRRRADAPDTSDAKISYFELYTNKAITTFLLSVKSQPRISEVDAALKAQAMLPESMNAMEFIKSGYSYLASMDELKKVDPDVIEAFELCADPALCGATMMDNYKDELDWRQNIAVWMEKVAKLRD